MLEITPATSAWRQPMAGCSAARWVGVPSSSQPTGCRSFGVWCCSVLTPLVFVS